MAPRSLLAGCWLMSLVAFGAAVADDVGIETSIERAVTATPEEMSSATPAFLAELKATVAALAALDAAAAKKSAGESLPCVTNNLSTARSLLGVSETASNDMATAIAASVLDRARFEYRKIAISVKKSRSLLAESERCAFGEGFQEGKSRTDLVASAVGTSNETSGVPDDVLDYGFDPPNASPF